MDVQQLFEQAQKVMFSVLKKSRKLQLPVDNQLQISREFQQCGILTSVDSDEPVQPPFKLRNSKCFSVSSLTLIEYSSD